VSDPDRPEHPLRERPRAVGATLTDVRAPPSPVETTRVTAPLLTADESAEGDDNDGASLSNERGPPRLAVEDDGDGDGDGFLDSSTVVENAVLPHPDAPTRVTATPRTDALPGERTVVAPIDFAALNAPSAPTANAHGDSDSDSDGNDSEFDAPTMVGGELPDVVAPPDIAATADATFVGTMDLPQDDAAGALPPATRSRLTHSTRTTATATATATTTTLSPLAYIGIGFAAGSAVFMLIALLWSMR
jgi:hypothetical protein